MAVPAPPVLASAVDGLLLLVFAVGVFAVVAVVAVVVLALIQAVLPGGDSGADALHAAQAQRDGEPAERDAEAEPAPEPAEAQTPRA